MLVPRTLLPIEIEEATEAVRVALTGIVQTKPIQVTDSFAWYRDAFGRCGTWESWIWETVLGKDYGTREPHFDGFVVFGERLGRAGAGIADLAIRSNRAVLLYRDGNRLESVRTVAQIDPNDMVTGWGVESTPVMENANG